ncbi:MAG: hypothetical protein LUG16_02550 [Candidatus Gastranaerophilales bacterium]|nr:hypothetical protein [Candidatus Gastranaerophilales bacterium]
MNKIYCLLLIFLLFISGSVNANQNDAVKIDSLIKELPEFNSISCKFKQEKQLQNISKPIISGGNFKFTKNEGIVFETTYPIKSEVSYTNKNYKQINEIIKAISSKNYSKIEKEFLIYFEKKDSNWKLTLKPEQNSKTQEVLNSITIEGSEIINKIIIDLKNGNKTTIWFMTE